MRLALVALVLVIIGCHIANGAINPVPETFVLPNPGIRFISLARNTTTVVVATFRRAYALHSENNGGPMKLISTTDDWSGLVDCLLVDEGSQDVGILHADHNTETYPMSYTLYHFQEPTGTLVKDNVTSFNVDGYGLVCSNEPSERGNGQSGFYFTTSPVNNVPNLYFMSSRYSRPPSTFSRVGTFGGLPTPPQYVTTGPDEITVIPGTNTSQYLPTTVIATLPARYNVIKGNPAVVAYSLPTPGAVPLRTRAVDAYESGPQYVNLFGVHGPNDQPWYGVLITPLVNSYGLRLQAYDFSTFTPMTNSTAVTDANTIVGPFPQKIIHHRSRYDRCWYIVGSHSSSTSTQRVFTLTQWRSSFAWETPKILDQVVFKLRGQASSIISVRSSWVGYVYLADDVSTIYRFQTQC